MSNPTSIELARRLEITPSGLEHTFQVTVQAVWKSASRWHSNIGTNGKTLQPQKTPTSHWVQPIMVTHSVVLASECARFHEMFEPLPFKVIRVENPNLIDFLRT